MKDNPAASRVLDFWFGEAGSACYGRACAEWFRKSNEFDTEIARRFMPLILQALRGDLLDWARDAQYALARILLLDQFTRNVFRDTPRAFAGDALALAGARAMVSAGQDESLLPVQRGFVYLPFEHSESLRDQDESVRLYTRLASIVPETEELLAYAQRHRAVIARFGRFVQRNVLQGRESTAEELEFLRQPGSRF